MFWKSIRQACREGYSNAGIALMLAKAGPLDRLFISQLTVGIY